MRRISIALVFFACACFADESAPTNKLWFAVGEELVYDIHWGFINIGQTHVTTAWTNFEGKTAIRLRITTKTNKFIENFYPVDDVLESMVDPDTFLPYTFKKKLSEGRYRTDEFTTFDHEKLEMRWENLKRGKVKQLPIEPDTRDIITMMYYLRSQPIALGVTNSHRVMADEKLYDLFVASSGEQKMKLGKWGKIPCYRVEPQAAFDGLFVRKGKITLWVSLDPRFLMTRMMASVPVANIRLTLTDVRGPGDDFWVDPKGNKKPDELEEPEEDETNVD